MKNVLYIGNALSNSGKTQTTIETLSAHLMEICAIKMASKKSNEFLRLLDMIKLVSVNRSNSHIVLIDTYSTYGFYFALVISQLCRVYRLKYITILHGGNLEMRLRNNRIFSNLIFENAHKLIAPSFFLKTIFENYGYTKIAHIPNCVQIKNYRFLNREIKGIRLLWVRSFSEIYNPELAVLVLENLKEKGFKASLSMVGPEIDGSFIKVKALAKAKNLEVNFTGRLSKADWTEHAKDYNIFINTTDVDNTPISVIEAMALGLPVVSTNVGGLPFLISNNEDGLLVAPKNVNAMVNAIIKLQENRTLKNKIVRNARAKVETFDWENVKSKWESLLC